MGGAKENEVKHDMKDKKDKRELMWGRCCGWLGWQGCSRWVVSLGHSLGECYRGAFQGVGSSHKRAPVYSKERAHCVSCTASVTVCTFTLTSTDLFFFYAYSFLVVISALPFRPPNPHCAGALFPFSLICFTSFTPHSHL